MRAGDCACVLACKTQLYTQPTRVILAFARCATDIASRAAANCNNHELFLKQHCAACQRTLLTMELFASFVMQAMNDAVSVASQTHCNACSMCSSISMYAVAGT